MPARGARTASRAGAPLVTGAGSGIGEAVARALHAEGAAVRPRRRAPRPVEAHRGRAGRASRATAAARRPRRGRRSRGAAGDVDVLVNVAGIGSTTNAPDTPLEVWEDVFAVNARGTFLCCKHAIPGMVERGGGSIVNVALGRRRSSGCATAPRTARRRAR